MTMKKHHLTWNESRHSVGISLIDAQHREILERANKIADAVASGDRSKAVEEMLDELVLFAREHFAFEERLMAENSYPDMESHVEEHFRLLQQLNNLIKGALHTASSSKAALASAFLTDWVERHILQADKELGEFLTAKGLS